VENEYGSFYSCDNTYTTQLKDTIKSYVGNDAILFTTDGSSRQYLRCGLVSDVYATIDFGTSGNVAQNFKIMREFEPKVNIQMKIIYDGLTYSRAALIRLY
jgi:beta-galactosidase